MRHPGVLSLFLILVTMPWTSPPGYSQEALPPPASPIEVPVTAAEARSIVEDLFGCNLKSIEEDAKAFEVQAEDCTLPCPLDRVRNTRCGEFQWEMDEARVYRSSWVAPVSGHLARNRVLAVDLRSSSAGLAYGSLHGVLVFPGASASTRSRPAFVWYLTRLGRTLGLDLVDVNADGTLDLLYTYTSTQVAGLRLVSRDVWTVTNLAADRLIASGDTLAGVAMGTFDGIPLHRDGEDGFERGAWRLEILQPSRPPLILIERAVFPGSAGPAWEFQVITDFGEGWREVLSGAPESDRDDHLIVDGVPAGACVPSEAPVGLSFQARARLLWLETFCRQVRKASRMPSGHPFVDATRWLLAARRANEAQMRVVGLGLESAAAMAAWRGAVSSASQSRGVTFPIIAWALSGVLSAHVAWAAHREAALAHDPRFTERPAFTEFLEYPALGLVAIIVQRLSETVRPWLEPSRLAPGTVRDIRGGESGSY